MATYAQISAEILDLESAQREITMIADPTEADTRQLWQIEGKLDVLRKDKDAAHEREIADSTPLTPVPTGDIAPGSFRNMLRNQEFEIVNALARGTGDGQYLVGQEWHDMVEKYIFEANFLRQTGARVIKTSTTHNIPILDGLPTAAFVGENTAYTASDPSWTNKVLYAWKATLKVPVSEELLEDTAYPIDAEIAYACGTAIGNLEEKYFLTGSGTTEPIGIFNKTADKTTSGSATVTNDEWIQTVYELARQYRDGAVWMMHDTTVAALAVAKLTVTSSGSLPYFWQNSVDGEPPKFLGYPVYTNSNIPTIGTGKKFAAFGNPVHYMIGERGPLKAKRLVLSEYQDTFAFSARRDGLPIDVDAFAVVINA